METKMFTLFWLGLIMLSLSLVMLISGLLKLLVIISYRHQQQCSCLLREKLDETKPQLCKKGEEEEKLEMLTQLRTEGWITEEAFQREVKQLKFDKYWY